jgi:nucleotide-binding universal stress UspA family protein
MIGPAPTMSILAISRVLCAIDLSGHSRHVLREALALARRHDAAVRVVAVIDLTPITRDGTEFDVTPERRAAVEEDLNWMAASVLDAAVPVETVVCEGPVAATICGEAIAARSDVIVIGTHGRSGLERLALGSVAEKVVSRASCPVLVVPAPEDPDAPPVLPRVVVGATDFSSAGQAAVEWARFVAVHAGAALSLITVTERPFGEPPASGPVADLMRSIDAEAARQLQGSVLEGPPPTRAAVRAGKPWRAILEVARAERAGLIVMGVSGHDSLGLGFFGSTTRHVMREGPCPVLAVPPPAGR